VRTISTDKSRTTQQEYAQTGDNPIVNPKLWRSLSTAIQNQELMPKQNRLSNDGPHAAWRCEPDQSNDHVDA
jgi:hypothetical protein